MEKGYFMLRVTHINRATKNIVASASYRSDEALYSERTDENIKFRNHIVKPESMILTPQYAPEWTKDRQRLWNEVDKVEKNNAKTKNPRLAKEVLLSLPNDFDREVQTELTKDFIKSEFVDKGMVADISIHRDDMNNPHAHVLLTQRPFNSDGTWGKKTKTKTRYDENGRAILNQNGNKVRKQERFADFDFKEVRKHWELKLNQYSEREQSLRRYDSRSFEAQGLEKIAEIPLTREEYRLEKNEQKRCEKEGIEYKPVTYYAQKNEQIRQYNRGEVSQIFSDKEKEQAQNEIRLLVQNANDQVSENEQSYSILFDSYKEDIDDDLRIDIGDKNFEKVKDQTPNEKVQLLIKLEKYHHVDQEEVIEKHIHQVDRNDDDNHLEHEYEQSNHIHLPTINASDFLMYYVNETEKQNNINHKKKKKKQDRNNQIRR